MLLMQCFGPDQSASTETLHTTISFLIYSSSVVTMFHFGVATHAYTHLCIVERVLSRVVIPGNPDPEFPGFGVFFPIPIPGLYV